MKNCSLFGNRLKEQRKKLGLNQSEAAEKCGVSREIWGKWERGENKPTSEKLFSFEKIGIDVNYVMYGNRVSLGAALAEIPQIGSAIAEVVSAADSLPSQEEQELLNIFRQLGNHDRHALKRQAQILLAIAQSEVSNNQHTTNKIEAKKVGQVIQASDVDTIQGNTFNL